MGLLTGKKGIVFGVANERSIAWHIARNLIEHGVGMARQRSSVAERTTVWTPG